MPIDKANPEIAGEGLSEIQKKIFEDIPDLSVIIDIGCRVGAWQESVNRALDHSKNIFKIGIDPINHNLQLYNVYLNCAVGLKNQETTDFYIFDGKGAAGCNSMLAPTDELLSATSFTCDEPISVQQRRLDSIWEEFSLEKIYYIKCDCQGADLDVIKSLGKYLPYVKYIEMEVSLDAEHPFYKGSNTVEEAFEFLESNGFKPIEFSSYPVSPLPEGEILFENKSGYYVS